MNNSILMAGDSYKIGSHFNMMPANTEYVYSYYESRKGAKWDDIIFFGLQRLLKERLTGIVVTQEKIDSAALLCEAHFGNSTSFNRKGWEYILNKYNGKLPIRIKAVPEGSVVPINNVLMTVENTDSNCFWLTNFLESVLSHLWYPCLVSTQSREIKKIIAKYLNESSDNMTGLDFMLHDFSFRSATSVESAAIASLAHIVNFLGTDSYIALQEAVDYYNSPKDYKGLAYSVPANEHSIATSLGKTQEVKLVGDLLTKYPNGILSLVADSYDYHNFVENIIGIIYKDKILERDGILVVRPDSLTPQCTTQEDVAVWTLKSLWDSFSGDLNRKGMKVLNSKVKVLMGDGLDKDQIEKILQKVIANGFSVESLVFGCGSGLIQKGLDRDKMRMAFKSSAQCRNGVWYDVQKEPLDKSKASKKGRLKLVMDDNLKTMVTVPESDPRKDLLQVVFENGKLMNETTFEQVRERAKL